MLQVAWQYFGCFLPFGNFSKGELNSWAHFIGCTVYSYQIGIYNTWVKTISHISIISVWLTNMQCLMNLKPYLMCWIHVLLCNQVWCCLCKNFWLSPQMKWCKVGIYIQLVHTKDGNFDQNLFQGVSGVWSRHAIWHQGITWANLDSSSIRSHGIYLKTCL